jgi:hypothetical protein
MDQSVFRTAAAQKWFSVANDLLQIRVSQRVSFATAREFDEISGSDVADVSCKWILTVNRRANSANHSPARLRARASDRAKSQMSVAKGLPQFVIVDRPTACWQTAWTSGKHRSSERPPLFSYRGDRRPLFQSWRAGSSRRSMEECRVFRPERPNFPDGDVWTARRSKLETRRDRCRLVFQTPSRETSNEHRVASNRSRGRPYGFAIRRLSPFQIVRARRMGQDERLR